MAIHELTLKTIMDDLDGGRIGEAFQTEIRRIIGDMDDRPADNKDRRVTLEFIAKPICGDQGELDTVVGKFRVVSAVPKRRSKDYSFGVRQVKGQLALVFNDLSDDNVNQLTFDE